MPKLGEAVVLYYDGEQHIGEVVGVFEAALGVYCDVSLERIVVKAVPQDELAPVSDQQLKAVLAAMIGPNAPKLVGRDAILRQRYVAFITKASLLLENDKNTMPINMGYEVGSAVGVRMESAYALGTVRGVSRQNDKTVYEIESLGDVDRFEEDDVMPLDSEDLDAERPLGLRARLVVIGHERDEAYVGTVCMMEKIGEGTEYSIMFDDGDILGGLTASDLAPCTNLSKEDVVCP